MRLEMLLEMASGALGDRTGFSDASGQLTYADLARQARTGAAFAVARQASAVIYVAEAGIATPPTIFAAALAGIPYVPLNYRLSTTALTDLFVRHPGGLIVTDSFASDDAAMQATDLLSSAQWKAVLELGEALDPRSPREGDDATAALLYTSGTTAAPKAAILRHRHLTGYVIESVEFASAGDADASIACLPPYHVAGLMSVLTNLYAGRRLHFMPRFDPARWFEAVETEQITHATVVPTMLTRLLATARELPRTPQLASLRTLASGGALLPAPVARAVLEEWPAVGLVNAYGLTETSSTISVMNPAGYREALTSPDPAVQARLASVGHPIPGIEVSIRRPDGSSTDRGEVGEIFVRGAQISGEYVARPAALHDDWFATHDLGHLDDEGYLFVHGRMDDTIIRGGENIAPAAIEDVLLEYSGVEQAVVVGVPDDDWGQRIVAVVVAADAELDPEELARWAKERLRTSMTPQEFHIWPMLPVNDAGKVVRRDVIQALAAGRQAPTPNHQRHAGADQRGGVA